MNYYYDAEFIEGTQRYRKTFLEALFAIKIFTEPTIDLISIGIVAEDGGEYYAVSKDFNLKEAWNRHDLVVNRLFPIGPEYNKSYWIRDNVLKPIYLELLEKELDYRYSTHEFYKSSLFKMEDKDYKQFKYLINKYGKSNKQIAEEIKEFIAYSEEPELHPSDYNNKKYNWNFKDVQFYGYYCDYDWVVFCWLFGKMIDLPKGFPMYCKDLKQSLDEKVENAIFSTRYKFGFVDSTTKKYTLEEKLNKVRQHPDYPKQTNEHNALSDAHWNKQLHEFLNTL